MSILKKNINLHPFTAPSADTILIGAGINDTDTAGNSDTGGKEGGEPQYLPSEATRAKICKMQRAECERLLTEAKEILNILNEFGKKQAKLEKIIAELKKELVERKELLVCTEKKIAEYKKELVSLEKGIAERKKKLADDEKRSSDAEKDFATFCSIENKCKPFVEAVAILLEKRLAEIETESEAD